MSEKLIVSVCEMTSTDDVDSNYKNMCDLFSFACDQGAKFISFPENSLHLRVDMDKGEKFAFHNGDEVFSKLSELAKKNSVFLHLGSVALFLDGEINNVTVCIDENGEVSFPYSKMHLFDIELEGKKPIKESEYYRHGKSPSIIKHDNWKFGLSICYDLRFSEMYSYYAGSDVDVLLIPAAFLPQTGRAHWEILLRARAIENQCYVLAAAQGGRHVAANGASRETYGHSLIIDPWGEILGEVTEASENKVITAEIKKSRRLQVKNQLPMHNHRRFKANWSWTPSE